MNSLKGRLFFTSGLVLLFLAALMVALFVFMKNSSAEDEARRSALNIAAAAASFSMADLGQGPDHEKAAVRIAKNITGSAEHASVVIMGKSGRILGSIPTKASKLDFKTDPDCMICHVGGTPTVSAILALRPDGIETARAVVPISSEGACRKCHTNVAKPIGYAYVQMPTQTIREKANDENILFAAFTLLAAAGVFAVLAFFLAKQIYQPVMETVHRLAEAVNGGEVGKVNAGIPIELRSIVEKASMASKATSAVNPAITAAVDNLSGTQARLRAAITEIGALTGAEINFTDQVEKNLFRLQKEMEEVNSSVDLIAASTADNSSSLSDLTGSVHKVSTDSEQLALQVKRSAGSVQQMTRSVQVIAEQVELLVRSVESASGKVGYIESSSADIKGNAMNSAALSGEMSGSAMVGSEAVKVITESITSSYKEIMVAAESMRALKKASISVGGILKIINEINDKTKLLALNAAIIAAQAGEQGRSFAVVAHEIKGLSDRTASSTGDIGRIIETIQEGVDRALVNVSKSEEKLSNSVEAVGQAGSLLSGIATTASEAYEKTMLIEQAAERQAELTRDVALSVSQVAHMVDEIKRRVKDHGSGAEFVEASANSMLSLTEQVKLTVKEQADTSRYISEAFTIIDLHMKGVLKTISANNDLIGYMGNDVTDVKSGLEKLSVLLTGVLAAADSLETGIRDLKDLADGMQAGKEV